MSCLAILEYFNLKCILAYVRVAIIFVKMIKLL